MPRHLRQSALALSLATALGLYSTVVSAQSPNDESLEESTVVFQADFFDQFQPVSVNDMIDRIPGIGLALGRGGGGRRGIGGGGNEILINGQRITGKSNDSRDQLRRIAADQVDYIEIIRGTSEEIDVRGGGQVVNIVLLEAASRSSIAAELNADLIQDGTIAPGGRFSYTGQTGNFNYVFAAESEPRFRNNDTFEASRDPSGKLLEVRVLRTAVKVIIPVSRDPERYHTARSELAPLMHVLMTPAAASLPLPFRRPSVTPAPRRARRPRHRPRRRPRSLRRPPRRRPPPVRFRWRCRSAADSTGSSRT